MDVAAELAHAAAFDPRKIALAVQRLCQARGIELQRHTVAHQLLDVRSREALALRGLRARDGKGRAGALFIRRQAKQQTGAQLYIGLFDRKRRLIGQQTLPVCPNRSPRCFPNIFLFHGKAPHLPPSASTLQRHHL